ncbi:UNVERIFIED_CONTAM: hypothetical protein Slati_2362200 [Sesamum latifolium]|uniref:Reverse transcriptase zinc-binding domain-containing protein n=1 Tax=Sesamum latifolium TaxID=2727402 RepID=A0AAW2WAG7_9LAMI
MAVGGEAFTTAAAYSIFSSPGSKVGWSSLLLGPLKIPRNNFIFFLAILVKLSSLDKPWLSHLGTTCILCQDGQLETHDHLFFRCRYARRCLEVIRQLVRFYWLNREWLRDVAWASVKWRGRHIINAAFRALLASLVYHIWQERNRRRFQQLDTSSSILAFITVGKSNTEFLVLIYLSLLVHADCIDCGGTLAYRG